MFLYQAHLLIFATAVLKILFADIDGCGEIYFVRMLCFASGFDHRAGYSEFTEVIEDQPGIYFLKDQSLCL